MSEQNNVETPVEGGESVGFTPPATQEDLNSIIAARLSREREKYAGFDDLKAKAARLDEIEEQGRTELEKALARAEAAEKSVAERDAADEAKRAADEAAVALAAVAKQVAETKGVPFEALRGSSKDELEAHAEVLAGLQGTGKPRNFVPSQGTGDQVAASGSLAAGRERAKARTK